MLQTSCTSVLAVGLEFIGTYFTRQVQQVAMHSYAKNVLKRLFFLSMNEFSSNVMFAGRS
jgi:hypothetical protein